MTHYTFWSRRQNLDMDLTGTGERFEKFLPF